MSEQGEENLGLDWLDRLVEQYQREPIYEEPRWNLIMADLYLSQKLAEIDDPAKREELLQAMAHGSAAAWGHLNLLGEYDFSEDKLQDSVGIKPPKLTD
jgi:hypothetical protein